MGISTMIADYAYRIELKQFDHLFRKIEPDESWSEGSRTAWSVIKEEGLAQAEADAHVVSRSWLNQHIQHWAKAVSNQSKLRGLKDDNNNLQYMLAPSKSPLKEFAETSFRVNLEMRRPIAVVTLYFFSIGGESKLRLGVTFTMETSIPTLTGISLIQPNRGSSRRDCQALM